jgi:hypothetical protein
MSEVQANRWQALVSGVFGAVAGLLAMRYYWQQVAPLLSEQGEGEAQPAYPAELQLDDISLFGKQYRDDESSTAALGRMAYKWLTGSEPQTDEAKSILSQLVHWGYGLSQGGVYGVMHADAGFPDLSGGIGQGTLLWALGDELAVPLLGLQSGPTAVPPVQHANRLGAHLFYGVATAATTQLLRRLL